MTDLPEPSLQEPGPTAPQPAPVPVALPMPATHQFRAALLCGALFAAAGLLTALRAFADRVLPHIVVPANSLVFRDILDGRPIQKVLNWYQTSVPLLVDVRDLHPAFVITIGVLLAFALGIASIAVLNPTFRPVSRSHSGDKQEPQQEADSGSALSSRLRNRAETLIHIDRVHLDQALRVLIVCGLPVLAIWLLTGTFGLSPIIAGGGGEAGAMRRELLRYVALGVGLFAGYSIKGVAGRFGILTQAYLNDDAATPGRPGLLPSETWKAACAGIMFGLGLMLVQSQTLELPSEKLLLIFHRLGTFNSDHLSYVLRPYFLSVAISWFCMGLLLYALGRPGVPMARRAIMLVPVGLGLAILPSIRHPLAMEVLVKRFDATPELLANAPVPDSRRPGGLSPVGPEVGEALAKQTGLDTIAKRKPDTHDMVVFHPSGGFQVETTNVTDDGVIADPLKAPKALAFLKQRNYQSALSWCAVKTLFNSANCEFNNTAAIKTGLMDMERTPHMADLGDTVRNLLAICPATPENLALLREYADESKFAVDSRNASKLLGTLFRRFGEVKQAEKWYKRADMPASFMAKFHSERPLFHAGAVRGRFTWNGQPLAGIQVAVVPRRLNGLPRDMEPQLLTYDRELVSSVPEISPYYSLYHPRPFRLRWIVGGTRTTSDGRFEINALTEGEYYLVCTLPSNIHLNLPVDRDLVVQGSPRAFTLSYASGTINVGTVGFSLPSQPLSGSTARSR